MEETNFGLYSDRPTGYKVSDHRTRAENRGNSPKMTVPVILSQTIFQIQSEFFQYEQNKFIVIP